MDLNMLNVILIAVIAGFAIAGAYRGFSGELSTLIGAGIAAITLWFGAPYLRDLIFCIAPDLPQNASVFYIGIAAVIIAFVIFFMTSKMVKKIFQWVVPQPFDAIAGCIIGGTKAFLIISILAGVITASKDYIENVRKRTEESAVANAAAAFWADRFAKTEASETPIAKVKLTKED